LNRKIRRKKLLNILRVVSIIVFLISTTQVAYILNQEEIHFGYFALIVGIFGVFSSGFGASWIANIFLLFAWRFYNQKTSLLYSFIGVTFGALPLFFNQIPLGTSGHFGTITELKIGYYLWLGSILIALVGSFIVKRTVANNGYT
jgi:hypothetical protein